MSFRSVTLPQKCETGTKADPANYEEGCIGSARRDLRHPPCYRGHFQYNLLNETVGRAPPMGIQSQGGALHRTLGEGWGGIPSRSEASEA
jgi:hypothetical protein